VKFYHLGGNGTKTGPAVIRKKEKGSKPPGVRTLARGRGEKESVKKVREGEERLNAKKNGWPAPSNAARDYEDYVTEFKNGITADAPLQTAGRIRCWGRDSPPRDTENSVKTKLVEKRKT